MFLVGEEEEVGGILDDDMVDSFFLFLFWLDRDEMMEMMSAEWQDLCVLRSFVLRPQAEDR